jgi:hypothetical protein
MNSTPANSKARRIAKSLAAVMDVSPSASSARRTAVERELVLRLASVLWRLRRATGIETAIFESVTAEPGKLEHGFSRPTLVEAADLSDRNQLHLVATRQSDVAADNELSLNAKKDIGDCFLRLAELPTFALDRLSRYEHLLWRQARQIVFALESLRRRKRQPSRSSFPFSFRRREPGALSEESRWPLARSTLSAPINITNFNGLENYQGKP